MNLLRGKAVYSIKEKVMVKKYIILIMLFCFSFSIVQSSIAQEDDDSGFVVEGDFDILVPEKVEEAVEEETLAEEEVIEEEIVREVGEFITSDVLTEKDVEPLINFYIQSDINRKFTGLIENLKLEKIYGVLQDRKSATVYFDYSYSSVRNPEVTLFDKGKMTLVKFNSGKWFSEELSMYLKDEYKPYVIIMKERRDQQKDQQREQQRAQQQ
jgi:hypothetical protein